MSAVKNVAKRVDKLADKMAGETNGPIQRLGRKAGAAVGAPGLGSLIGRGIGRIVGTGDYQVMMNSLIKPGSERGHSMSAVSASFGTRGDVVRVRKREFAGMLTSASTANAFTS